MIIGAIAEQSIQNQIRWMVAQSVEKKTLLDVQACAQIIAKAHGLSSAAQEIATDLAGVAMAARVPMLLPSNIVAPSAHADGARTTYS